MNRPRPDDERFWPPRSFGTLPPLYADYEHARVVILPVPYDSTVTARAGAPTWKVCLKPRRPNTSFLIDMSLPMAVSQRRIRKLSKRQGKKLWKSHSTQIASQIRM